MLWRRLLNRAWNRWLARVPMPLRLSPGIWWLARGDDVGNALVRGEFEPAERTLLRTLVRRGATILDIGAHAGLYTLAAATLAGPSGRVIAFEPSARERERLLQHLRINRLANVTVEPMAVGAVDGETDFFVAQGALTGFNSRVAMPGIDMERERVAMCRLDTFAARTALARVDVIKIDVEGGERDVLIGGEMLVRRCRPAIVCEIEHARIEPWGYAPREILDLLESWGYECFAIRADGLARVDDAPSRFGGNYLAVPRAAPLTAADAPAPPRRG